MYEDDRSGLLSEVQYGNGGKVKYAYDDYDRMTGVKYDSETTDRYTYEYDASGSAVLVRDNNLGRVLQTEHDLTDRPMGTQLRSADGSMIYRTELDYDKLNRLVGFGEEAGVNTYKTSYTYDNDNRVTEIGFGGSNKVKYTYDNLGRIKQRTAVNGSTFTTQYGYAAGGYGTGSTTPLVASITQGDLSLTYAYDNRGNITRETRNGKTILYAYDALGQLYRVDDSHEGIVWCYYHDRGGNITERVKFNLSDYSWIQSYVYGYRTSGWKDVLESYNGTSLTHDAIGNLTNDGTWSYTWRAGRQLLRMSKTGTTIEHQYDHNGLRVGKIVTTGGVATTTEYTLHGKLVTGMKQGANRLHFFYDAQSRPAMVDYNGVIYTYAHNYQGDIIAILDSNGAIVVEYYYDAWGRQYKITGDQKDTLGKLNPFRYRGYIYDEESGLYYLRSRYYNPEWGRFINADLYIGWQSDISAHNVFAYCRNQCVNSVDAYGTFVFVVTAGLEDAILSIDQNGTTLNDSTSCSCFDDVIMGGVIPMTGPPNGYASGYNGNGDLYEGWYDSNGNLKRARHHSNHGNAKRHPKKPHDHRGIKDKNGKPTLDPKGEDPDPDYKTPEAERNSNAANVVAGLGLAYAFYQALEFLAGVFAAPVTGGASLLPAFMP